MKHIYLILIIFICLSCTKQEEFSLEEFESMGAQGPAEILAATESKPWRGEDFVPGRLGGVWN
jgi:peptide/nickel transport system substrate-binding protein